MENANQLLRGAVAVAVLLMPIAACFFVFFKFKLVFPWSFLSVMRNQSHIYQSITLFSPKGPGSCKFLSDSFCVRVNIDHVVPFLYRPRQTNKTDLLGLGMNPNQVSHIHLGIGSTSCLFSQ